MNKFATKELFGEKAIYGIGKLFFMPRGKTQVITEKLDSTLIAGVIITDECLNPPAQNEIYGFDRMVECEVIIIPKRIFEDRERYFDGMRIDQVLTGGYADQSNYYPVKE